MVRTRAATCMKCGHTFPIHEETSRRVHQLHCVRCGREKCIGISELKEYYHRYVGTLVKQADTTSRQLCSGSVHPIFPDELLDMRKYILMVEHQAGSCICGAVFRFSGKPRCPACRSVVIQTKKTKPSLAAGVHSHVS